MTSVQKIALSFLMTLVLFAGFLLTFNSYLFDFLEAKFYSQARILEKTEELNQISQGYNEYFTNFLSSINDNYNSWKNLESVRSFYEPNPSEVNVAGRRIANERLFRLYTALSGIRLIDKNGRNVHYSSFDDTDILKQSGISKIYKNYPDICKDSDEILFENFEKLSDEINSRILFDDKKNRLIICEPFFYSGNIFSGYALFYFDFLNLQKELIEKEYLEKNYSLSLFSDNELSGGIADGILNSEKEKFKEPLLKIWKNQTKKTESQTVVPEKIFKLDLDENNEDFLVVLTNSCDSKINVSGVYNSIFFEIPKDLQFVIYLCIFISLFLILFLIFSFKRDSMTVLNKKVKKLQLEIMQDCLEKGEKIKLDGVFQKLSERRNEISTEILKSLKIRSKKQSQEIENLLEKNWDEIFDFFKSQNDLQNNQNFSNQNAVSSQNLSAEFLQEIKSLLQEVLQNTEPKTISTAAPQLEKIEPVDEIEEVEDIDEIEEVEEVEEIEEVENEGLSPLEEVKNDSEAEEELEELENLEELTPLEEVEDANEGPSPLEEDAPETELEDLTPLEEVEEIAENLNSEEEFEDLEELAEEEVTATGENEDANEGLSPLDEASPETELEDLTPLEEPTPLEELTQLEEIPVIIPQIFNTEFLLKNQPKYEYTPSDETYFASENFATVDNVFAEEICLGSGIKIKDEIIPIEFKYFELKKYFENPSEKPSENQETTELQIENKTAAELQNVTNQKETQSPQSEELQNEIEELSEEVPVQKESTYYSMTNFAENLTDETPILDAAEIPENAIIEEDGVFSISQIKDYEKMGQDKDFKSLVDSIL